MKYEPNLSNKEKSMLYEAKGSANYKAVEWSHSDSPAETELNHSRRVYYRDPHLDHAAGDYEPLQHEEKINRVEQRVTESRITEESAPNKVPPASFLDEQIDEHYHLLTEENHRAKEIEMIRSSYGAFEQDRQ